jgi:hypothetical protein
MGYDSHIYFTIFNTEDPKGEISYNTIHNIVNIYNNFKYSFTEHSYRDWIETDHVCGSSTGQITRHKSWTKAYIDKTRTMEVDISEWFPIMSDDDRGSLACGVTDCFIEGFSQFSKLFPTITFRMYVTHWDNMCLSVYDFVNGKSIKLLNVSNEDQTCEIEHSTYDFLKERDDLFDYINEQCQECKDANDADDDDIDYKIDLELYLTKGENINEFFEEH